MNPILMQSLIPEAGNLPSLLRDWRADTMSFARHDIPKIVLVVVGSLVVIRLLRAVTNITTLQTRKLPARLRTQQARTLANVITSVGVFAIVFVATLMVMKLFGLDLGPLLASAGIAGVAIGFGAQLPSGERAGRPSLSLA